jgi:prepilin-type N-terminal cleavage/methylation domain-containing protein
MRILRSSSGFTLIEVLVSLVLVVTMVLAVTTLLFASSHSNTTTIDQSAANRQIQQQIDSLRAASYGSLVDGTYSFTTTGINRVQSAQYVIADYTDGSGAHTALKKISVTIIWNEGTVAKTATAQTYIGQHGINQQ